MRIIGGVYKGRKLKSIASSENTSLRPTSAKVKESIFNILSHKFHLNLHEIKILDLFAGTGSLGFEAISRGAKSATFVESDKYACKLIMENAKTLGVESKISLKVGECQKIGLNKADPFELIFMDPPYGKSLGEKSFKNVLKGNWIKKHSLIVWEEGAEISNIEGGKILETRKYGETVLSFVEVMI